MSSISSSFPQLKKIPLRSFEVIDRSTSENNTEEVVKKLAEESLSHMSRSEETSSYGFQESRDHLLRDPPSKTSSIARLADDYLSEPKPLSFSALSLEEMKKEITYLESPPLIAEWPDGRELQEKDFWSLFPHNQSVEPRQYTESGGSKAHIYFVKVDDEEFVVRSAAGFFGFQEIFQENAIAKTMGERGIAPRVHASKPEKKILVLNAVKVAQKIGFSRKSIESIVAFDRQMMELMKRVHETPLFAYESLNRRQCMIGKRIASDYIKRVYPQVRENHLLQKSDQEILDRLVNIAYPSRAGKLTLIHGDPQPTNVLYDGNRLWLIDWELSGLGHPFYDIAYFANYQVKSFEEGNQLLSLYLGRAPSFEEKNQLQQLRGISLGFMFSIAMTFFIGMGGDANSLDGGKNSFDSLEDAFCFMGEKDFESTKENLYRLSLTFLRASSNFL